MWSVYESVVMQFYEPVSDLKKKTKKKTFRNEVVKESKSLTA